MNNPYPNSFYVEKHSPNYPLRDGWMPLITSVSYYKTYAQGYLEACDSFQPHNGYRLIGKDGSVLEERKSRGPMKVN